MASPGESGGGAAADLAAERVREIVAAAEQAAAAIIADAEAEAQRVVAVAEAETERIRAAAASESAETVSAANREASGRIEQARAAVEGLVTQADVLRAQVGALGRGLASSVPGGPAAAAETEANEEDAPTAEEADADRAADARAAEQAEADRATDAPAGSDHDPADASPESTGAPAPDQGGARLVAMNLALEGASREEITERIEADFGPMADIDALLDDVFSRAGR